LLALTDFVMAERNIDVTVAITKSVSAGSIDTVVIVYKTR